MSNPQPLHVEEYIKKLKRSPESPSRLTLPPIMAVIEHEHSSLTSSSNSHAGWDQSRPRGQGWYDPTLQPLEKEVEHIEDIELWQSTSPPSDLCYHDESLPPVDPFSPPPPSPSLSHVPSPLLPDTPQLTTNDNYSSKPRVEGVFSATATVDRSLIDDLLGLPLTLPEHPIAPTHDEAGTSSLRNEEETETMVRIVEVTDSSPPKSRRRRTTLSEAEDYRRYALWRTACLTVIVQQREEMERVERLEAEGLTDTEHEKDERRGRTRTRGLEQEVDNGDGLFWVSGKAATPPSALTASEPDEAFTSDSPAFGAWAASNPFTFDDTDETEQSPPSPLLFPGRQVGSSETSSANGLGLGGLDLIGPFGNGIGLGLTQMAPGERLYDFVSCFERLNIESSPDRPHEHGGEEGDSPLGIQRDGHMAEHLIQGLGIDCGLPTSFSEGLSKVNHRHLSELHIPTSPLLPGTDRDRNDFFPEEIEIFPAEEEGAAESQDQDEEGDEEGDVSPVMMLITPSTPCAPLRSFALPSVTECIEPTEGDDRDTVLGVGMDGWESQSNKENIGRPTDVGRARNACEVVFGEKGLSGSSPNSLDMMDEEMGIRIYRNPHPSSDLGLGLGFDMDSTV